MPYSLTYAEQTETTRLVVLGRGWLRYLETNTVVLNADLDSVIDPLDQDGYMACLGVLGNIDQQRRLIGRGLHIWSVLKLVESSCC